ncbi:hypothetical protein [Candidatus Desulfovibrio trichonymphae]|uniref:Uncharacterized protein n=1 Tax=Candidatus Desulfovibrio trichonymphae TaxID=1725232 RepID=A0A1J1DQC1_9BACT|nr:hypothetical protein [Candidatus Desulfovibrio trichonymphae]BAV92010.1 conserved hypothetical protein [Candidatus Desulfovibrio trichonymphae]GHU92252.1 hypothetical protein AGMMS49925_10030 [Deltaproteobacteria bacterium]
MPAHDLQHALAGTGRAAAWPEWAEDKRIDDAFAEQAYNATSPQCRAALKTGLALAFMHFGQSLGCLRAERRDNHLGYWLHTTAFPAPWALVAFTPGFTAAARLAAACVPAQLAGVPLLGAVCVDGEASRQALVSLELSGVEDIFMLDTAGLFALLEEVQPSPGRLVLMHTGELSGARQTARALGIPCYEESRPPSLVLPEPDAFDMNVLAFAQGSALEHTLEPAHPVTPAALYLADKAALGHCRLHHDGPHYADSLALSPGCEGFWLHTGLTPDFFRVSRLAFGPLADTSR